MKPLLLIPAYKPNQQLLDLLVTLTKAGFPRILVLDDGSGTSFTSVFEKAANFPGVRILRHAVNLGKGRAIKTAINDFLLNEPSDNPGIITLDADGQHLPEDVIRIADALEQDPSSIHLGVRAFGRSTGNKTPWKSLLGNQITRSVFGWLTGLWLRDTQTGLRGIPRNLLQKLIEVRGERYEFEIGMLLSAKESGVLLREHTIQTVYIDNNRDSHFDPFVDSMRIYFVLARFASSSFATSFVDFIVFSLSFMISQHIGISIIAGRLVASVLNFFVNRRLVFHSRGKFLVQAVKYYTLVIILGAISYTLIKSGTNVLGIPVIPMKIIVELALFITSFSIQRDMIFDQNPVENGKTHD